MSYHRENVIWQSADGTWSRGFFQRERGFGAHDEDYDPEWDDDFDFDRFEWVSAGHRTANEAAAAWDGANPGGYTEYSYRPDDPDSVQRIAQFDDMAAVLCVAEAARQIDRWGWSRYHGTPKRRTTAAVQASRDRIIEAWVSSRSRGYDNELDLDGRLLELDADLAGRYQTASVEERAAFDERDTKYRAKLRDLLAKYRQDYVDENRRNSRYSFSSYSHDHAKKRSDCFAEVAKYLDQLDEAAAQRTRPAPKKATRKAAPSGTGTARGKTTAASTAGSFAPRQLSDPGTTVLGR